MHIYLNIACSAKELILYKVIYSNVMLVTLRDKLIMSIYKIPLEQNVLEAAQERITRRSRIFPEYVFLFQAVKTPD